MFCDAYHNSLTEVAAAGRELTPALEQHLAFCRDCRAAFAEQQSFFAAIDAGIRSLANPEIPLTVIPRVHIALHNELVGQARSPKWIFAGTALAAVLVVAFVLTLSHRDSPPSENNARMRILAPPSIHLLESHAPNPFPFRPAARANEGEVVQPVSAHTEVSLRAEVLVPDEERAAFARFLTHEQSAPTTISAAIALIPEAPKVLTPLQLVEIASLKVPSLDGGEASRDEH
jgi:hypothetical protein